MRSFILTTALIAATSLSAFDLGSTMETVAPIAQSVAPTVDTSLSSNPLIKNLTTKLGVTPTQAIGGTASLVYNAKQSISQKDFSALTKQKPIVNSILSSVPSNFLQTGSTASQFSMLGMDPSMVSKFSPLVLEYLQSGTKPGMSKILATAFAE